LGEPKTETVLLWYQSGKGEDNKLDNFALSCWGLLRYAEAH